MGPQVPYYGAPPPAMPPQKPSAFYKVTGIIQIVLGIAGVLYSLFGMVTTAFAASYSPSASSMYDMPTLVFTYLHLAVAVVTGAALLATGIGMVRAKRWARFVGVGYAVTSLLNTVGSTVVQLAVIQPRMYSRMGALGMHGLETIVIVSTLFGVLVAAVVPVFTLVALLRAAAKVELDVSGV